MGSPGWQGKPKLTLFGKELCRPFMSKPKDLNSVLSISVLPTCALQLKVKLQEGVTIQLQQQDKSKPFCRLEALCFASSIGKRAVIYLNYSPLEQHCFTNNGEWKGICWSFSVLLFLFLHSVFQETSLKQNVCVWTGIVGLFWQTRGWFCCGLLLF